MKRTTIRNISREMKKAVKSIIKNNVCLYFIIVFGFAFAYTIIFHCNTTSFQISEQFNKHVDRFNYLDREINVDDFHNKAKDIMPIDISDFCEFLKPDLKKLNSIQKSLENNKILRNNCNSKLDSIWNIARILQNDSIKKFENETLSKYQDRIDSLKSIIEANDSTVMIIQRKYVELANLQADYTNKQIDVLKHITKNRGSFIPDTLNLMIDSLKIVYNEIDSVIITQESDKHSLETTIQHYKVLFENNRTDSVSFWDFLYYSICVSTTVSFGDIAPNNDLTRFVSILELLFCILLVHKILKSFERKRDQK